MINKWMELPKNVKRLMRCPLTPRHPPVPLVSTLWHPASKRKTKSSSSVDDVLNSSVDDCSPRQSAERSDTSLLSSTSTDDESPWGQRRKPPGLLQSVCSQLFNQTQQQQQQKAQVVPEMSAVDDDEDTLSDVSDALTDNCDSGSCLPPHLDREEDEGGEQVVPVCPSHAASPAAPNPPAVPLLSTLGLDLSIECIPRYQNKPKSMYTFVCAQDFRRDQYADHYRNWHSDIHGGLDGWLEQRCPLARWVTCLNSFSQPTSSSSSTINLIDLISQIRLSFCQTSSAAEGSRFVAGLQSALGQLWRQISGDRHRQRQHRLARFTVRPAFRSVAFHCSLLGFVQPVPLFVGLPAGERGGALSGHQSRHCQPSVGEERPRRLAHFLQGNQI